MESSLFLVHVEFKGKIEIITLDSEELNAESFLAKGIIHMFDKKFDSS